MGFVILVGKNYLYVMFLEIVFKLLRRVFIIWFPKICNYVVFSVEFLVYDAIERLINDISLIYSKFMCCERHNNIIIKVFFY